MEFGQSYCRDILTIIPVKFIFHFSDVYIIYYQFSKFK
jgi:hypothetical protein